MVMTMKLDVQSNDIKALKELVIHQANTIKILSDQVSSLHLTVNKIGSMFVESSTFSNGHSKSPSSDKWVLSVKNDIRNYQAVKPRALSLLMNSNTSTISNQTNSEVSTANNQVNPNSNTSVNTTDSNKFIPDCSAPKERIYSSFIEWFKETNNYKEDGKIIPGNVYVEFYKHDLWQAYENDKDSGDLAKIEKSRRGYITGQANQFIRAVETINIGLKNWMIQETQWESTQIFPNLHFPHSQKLIAFNQLFGRRSIGRLSKICVLF